MKPILTRLFAGLFLLLAAQAFGQMTTNFVVTTPPSSPQDYPIGTKIVIELRVTNFTDIVSMQFPITYNKDAMKFDSIGDPAFSNWNAGYFVSVPASGKVGISWDGFSGGANMPFTFPNGTAIFKLHFTVIGNGTSSVNISGAAAPPSISVEGNGGGAVTLNYQSGGTPTIILGTGNPPPPPPPPLVGFKIVANTIYIPQGERGCMPVTVNDFDNIQSMQWALHWDNAVLNYECTRNYNLPGWSNNDFATAAAGTLLATWSDPAGNPVTRADGVRIVDICFKAVGAPGATNTITIDGNGFGPSSGGAEAINTSNPPVNVWTTGGPNGASGVSAPINIIVTNPPATDVTYTVDTIVAANGTVGCVAVKVKNFTTITSSEFALTYNMNHLTYKNVDFGANPLTLQASNISNVTDPPNAKGFVKFFWANANGASVTDLAPIFTACFTVIAPTGTTANINFTSTPCPSPTGIGTAKSGVGVSMARNNGWIKSMTSGPGLSTTPVSCFGGNNGTITLTNPPSTTATGYAWAGPGINAGNQSQQNLTGIVSGTYTVTVTYTGGTTGTASATVTQPLQALSQTNSVNTISCFGGSNGAINLTPAGGTPPYTYAWTDGGSFNSTVQDPANLTIGIYTLTLKDANQCTLGPINVSVSGFSAIAIQGQPTITNVTCTGLSTGAIVINPTGGAGNYTYDWSNDGAESPDNDTKDLTGMPAGNYTLTITDSNGCTVAFPTNGQSYTITPAPAFTVAKDNTTDVKCFNSATGSANITVTGGTGNKTYCWSTGAGPCVSNVEDPTNLPAGTYTFIVTDQNNCTATVSNIVIQNAPSALDVNATTTPSACFEQASGTLIANASGGWGGYGYAWTGPISPIPGVSNLTNLPGGNYTVTVTDSKQCTVTKAFTVGGSPEIVKDEDIQAVTCYGTNNGGIDLNLGGGNPPYTVAWSNTPLTGEAIGVLAPGVYQPTVTDNQGCIKIFAPVTVTGPQELLVAETITEANPANGAINIEITQGGTPTFNYKWSTGATTQDIASLIEGIYTVTITDANACERIFTYTVPNGNVVGTSIVQSIKPACSGDGCIFLTLPQTAAGFMPVTLNWGFGTKQTSSLTPSICDLNAGLYNVTVTASNGNSTVIPAIQVGQNDPASVNSNTTNPFSSLTKNGKITLDKASGVVCNLLYQWGPAPLNSTSNEVSNLAQGTYGVTVTNPCSGCVSELEFNLEYSPLGGVEEVRNPNCAASADGFVHINIQGGFLPYVFEWEGPNGYQSSLEDIDNLEPGVYNLTVTDQDSRVYTKSFTLTTQSNLSITNVNEISDYNGKQVSGANLCDGVANVAFIPGVGNTTISWSNGVSGASNSSLCGGPYSVTVTDAAGCSSVWSDELTAPAAISVIPVSDGVKCTEDCNGVAKVSVQGGIQPYTVKWSTGQTDPTIFSSGFSQAVNLCGGAYSVTVVDKNGVEFVTPVDVPKPDDIVVNIAPTTPRSFNSCDGELLINAAGAVAPITYVWSGSFGHSGDGQRADNLCSGEFVEFYITDANGCTAFASDSVPYPEDGCFRVSPVITPGQQDGKNDFVVITCIETASENHMEIYNRWGQLVFETDGYTNNDTDLEHNWNGLTKSGVALAEGVYYYVLTYTYTDDQGAKHDDTRKGAINLLR